MLRINTLKRMFSINPDRSNRFFTLRFKLINSAPHSSQYQKLIQQQQNNSSLLFAGTFLTNKQYFHVFQSPNQIESYEFLKRTSFYKNKQIESYNIEQIQMKIKMKDKQLAPKHLREQ